MKVAIIGSKGQLGSDLMKVFDDPISLTHDDIEVTDIEKCQILKELSPNVVINTAAFHRTDDCERMPLKSFQVNAIGAKNIAEICHQINAINIFISTDYVFDGKKDGLYSEEDTPNPINSYGLSKYAGEIYTKNYHEKFYIVRVSSLFGVAGASGKGGNFIETMINKAKENAELKVVDDIIMTPTYTYDVAKGIKKLLENTPEFGVYHVVNTGKTTWYKFAKEIFNILKIDANLSPTTSSEYKTEAERPKNSSLSNKKIKTIKIIMNSWEDALKSYLISKKYISS